MKLFILLSLAFPLLSYGHGGGSEGGPSVGPGKGVEWYDDHEGFILAKQAVQRIGVQTSAVEVKGSCDLTNAEVVSALGDKVIYILRDTKFLSIPPKCSNLRSGDKIVTHGASFLRVIEMDLKGGEEGEDEDEHGDEDAHEHGAKEGTKGLKDSKKGEKQHD